MFAATAQFSNTDSIVGGVFARTSFDADHQRLNVGLSFGNIKNNYNDYLGTGLPLRNEAELKTWMGVLESLLPPAPADVVDLGTGQGFVALVMAALGHRVRGFDLAQGQLDRAREYAARSANPPLSRRRRPHG